MPTEKTLSLKFNDEQKLGKADVYLACSWRPGVGRDAAYLAVKTLDENGFRVIGDAPDQDIQEESRIANIMNGCKGFLAVLPYRTEGSTTTSSYILEEIQIARKLKLPIGIFYDSRVNIDLVQSALQDSSNLVEDNNDIYFSRPFEEEVNHLELEVSSDISKFLDNISNTPRYIKNYAFLITSLESEYSQIRSSIEAAVYQATGLPTLWSDDPRIDTNIKGIREQTKLLIKDATIVIADLTINNESPAQESPNRAHEVGIALAYNKTLMLVSQNPRRHPYFSVNDLQFDFWDDESDLFIKLEKRLSGKVEELGRRVYNQEMINHNSDYINKIGVCSDFTLDDDSKYRSPALSELSLLQCLSLGISMSVIVFSFSKLFNDLDLFPDTLDFVPIIGTLLAFLLPFNAGRIIKGVISKSEALKITLPIVSILFMIFVYYIGNNLPQST